MAGKKRDRVLPLAALQKGDRGRIVALEPRQEGDLLKVLALGLIPGERVRVVHRRPLVVVQAGRSFIAMDGEMAEGIHVCRE